MICDDPAPIITVESDEQSAVRAYVEEDTCIPIDSGASNHIVPHREWFCASDFNPIRHPAVRSATGRHTTWQGIGHVPMDLGKVLKDALYVLGSIKALMFVVSTVKEGLYGKFSLKENGAFRICRTKDGLIRARAHFQGDGYYFYDEY